MSQNIWQIDNITDLIDFLKNSNVDYITLSIVLKTTDADLKSCIKKFTKRKAEKFPNVTFLYFTVQQSDFGKISFLSHDKSSYPMMLHIKTSSNDIMTIVESINDQDDMEKCWELVEDHYIANLKSKKNAPQQPSSKISEKSSMSFDQHNQYNQSNQNYSQINEVMEQHKKLKKLIFLKEKADEFMESFVEDC
jgi:hypothetical protein